MKKLITTTILILIVSLMGGCVPTSDTKGYENLINRTAILKKPMVLAEVENYAFWWIKHLVDPSRPFWAKYQTVQKVDAGQPIEITDIKSFTSKPGKQYFFEGRFAIDGKEFVFYYGLLGTTKPSLEAAAEIWEYQ